MLLCYRKECGVNRSAVDIEARIVHAPKIPSDFPKKGEKLKYGKQKTCG